MHNEKAQAYGGMIVIFAIVTIGVLLSDLFL